MEPKGAAIGPPAGRLNAGDPVRIWFRVRLLCSPPPNGLVGDGVLRPVRKGFRVFTAWGTLTNESRLTREEAEGPRKDSGVRRAGVSLLDGASASPSTSRSKASGSFVPFCFTLGVWSPNRSSSTGLLGFPEGRAWVHSSPSLDSVDTGGLANGSKVEEPSNAAVLKVSTSFPQGLAPLLGSLWGVEFCAQKSVVGGPAGSTGVRPQGSEEESTGGKSQGWLWDMILPEGTGDQGSAEGPHDEPLGSVLGLRPGMSHGSAEQCVEGRVEADAKMSTKSRLED